MTRWDPPTFTFAESAHPPADKTPTQRALPAALLTPQDVATLLSVELRWIYRHASEWPFTRKLGRKCLRFDPVGLRKWIDSRKPGD